MGPLLAGLPPLRSLAARPAERIRLRLLSAVGPPSWPGARRFLSAEGSKGPLAQTHSGHSGHSGDGWGAGEGLPGDGGLRTARWATAPELEKPRLFGLLADAGSSNRSPAGSLPPSGPSEYELDLGKIAETLVRDYRGFFEHEPCFDIYNEDIVFKVGRPFDGAASMRGRRVYCRALSAFRGVTRTTVRDGKVACSVSDGRPFGHALRVKWRFEGDMRLLKCPVYIDAISLYSIAPRAAPERAAAQITEPVASVLSHGVHRHTVEFVEIHPPSLRSLLQKALWEPKVCVAPLCFEQDAAPT